MYIVTHQVTNMSKIAVYKSALCDSFLLQTCKTKLKTKKKKLYWSKNESIFSKRWAKNYSSWFIYTFLLLESSESLKKPTTHYKNNTKLAFGETFLLKKIFLVQHYFKGKEYPKNCRNLKPELFGLKAAIMIVCQCYFLISMT